jgi:hypothetical protein
MEVKSDTSQSYENIADRQKTCELSIFHDENKSGIIREVARENERDEREIMKQKAQEARHESMADRFTRKKAQAEIE